MYRIVVRFLDETQNADFTTEMDLDRIRRICRKIYQWDGCLQIKVFKLDPDSVTNADELVLIIG